MTIALMNVYLTEGRHLDAYDMGNEFVKEIAFRKTFVPELNEETLIIDRLFYPEKYIFMRHVLANCDPRRRHREYGELRGGDVHRPDRDRQCGPSKGGL